MLTARRACRSKVVSAAAMASTSFEKVRDTSMPRRQTAIGYGRVQLGFRRKGRGGTLLHKTY